ncbi:hypothetical protein M378DRAFT_163804 [Amanita muscaria Koide BX008]|uniref:Uncharacterized protein n=1 Tax=Amanita muscaria (strain Koide BX008) TaxID=946122 RepID=A0A0C2WQD8_AMAMK|nr:hypothetical protein M378DRAFT_163804 [Amanita muscaria Koide BX008]
MSLRSTFADLTSATQSQLVVALSNDEKNSIDRSQKTSARWGINYRQVKISSELWTET